MHEEIRATARRERRGDFRDVSFHKKSDRVDGAPRIITRDFQFQMFLRFAETGERMNGRIAQEEERFRILTTEGGELFYFFQQIQGCLCRIDDGIGVRRERLFFRVLLNAREGFNQFVLEKKDGVVANGESARRRMPTELLEVSTVAFMSSSA